MERHLNQTWLKDEDGNMLLVYEKEVLIEDIPVEPDFRAWLLLLEKRVDALESKSEPL